MKTHIISFLHIIISSTLLGQNNLDSIRKEENTRRLKVAEYEKFYVIACPKPVKKINIDTVATKNFESRKGLLPIPADNYISLDYCHPDTTTTQIFSKGCSIKRLYVFCKPNTNAIAIAKGKVTAIVKITDKFVVIIRHGAYLSVYPNLDTVYVSKDQKITETQKIGRISTVDNITEIVFELWYGQTRVDPIDWIAIDDKKKK